MNPIWKGRLSPISGGDAAVRSWLCSAVQTRGAYGGFWSEGLPSGSILPRILKEVRPFGLPLPSRQAATPYIKSMSL